MVTLEASFRTPSGVCPRDTPTKYSMLGAHEISQPDVPSTEMVVQGIQLHNALTLYRYVGIYNPLENITYFFSNSMGMWGLGNLPSS